MGDQAALFDLGVADVHTPNAAGGYRPGAPTMPDLRQMLAPPQAPKERTMAEISTETRNALPAGKFALPAQRKYPIHDAAHVRNAAARLEQEKKAGKISAGDYAKAKRAIAAAAKKFGIHSELAAADKPVKGARVRGHLAAGSHIHVRALGDGAGSETIAYLPPMDVSASV